MPMTVDEALKVADEARPIPGWTQTRRVEALIVLADTLHKLRGERRAPATEKSDDIA